ncbi:hypothetical protein FQN51_000439 [Onygenales sp. PD_10]|nr:hypothetical protein FQN51_000439 [Onygenales sp. PD_10]
MNPLLSWAIVVGVATALGWYYARRAQARRTVRAVNARAAAPRPAAPKAALERATAQRNENGSAARKVKRKQRPAPDSSSSSATPTPPTRPTVAVERQATETAPAADDEVDNREFAKQFARVQQGTNLSTANKSNKKEVRTRKIVASPVEDDINNATLSRTSTRTSSTTGADADDDMSPVNSPTVNPVQSVSGDVSDMLEPAPAAVPVLRLVNAAQDEQGSKKKTQKPQKPVETKKQRQQRIKKENKRIMVEDAEKQRRALLEKQLHTARDNERREAAKSKPIVPPPSVWENGTTNGHTNGVHKTPSAPLLDTFDSTSKPAARPPTSTKTTKQIANSWTNDLPSEEEQLRIILSENEWTTVSSKKEKRKGPKPEGSVSDTSSSEFQAVKDLKPTITPTPVAPKLVDFDSWKGQPLDSEWDV